MNKLCHKSDPETSYIAADKLVKSGELNKQEKIVLEWIRGYVKYIHSDFTAKELADESILDYHLIQRRLLGLKDKGKIDRTGERRNGCCVWRLV